jgi:hypothetical protein
MLPALPAELRSDPRADTLASLDARLLSLTRSSGPLRRTLARLAAHSVKTRIWHPLAFARPAGYARERLGLSSRELHPLAHVDAALAALPAIDAALSAGQLG